MNLESTLRLLKDHALHAATLLAAKKEQNSTLELLAHLHEISDRRVFAVMGYSSLWDYTVRALGYSESSASERIGAMRLAYSVPEVKQALEQGEMTLTVASQVQTFLRAQKKEHKTYSEGQTAELIREVKGKSKRETERVLATRAPQMAVRRERQRALSATETLVQFTADEELMKMLERLRELKGHGSTVELLKVVLSDYLTRHDPLRRRPKLSQGAKASAQRSLRPAEVSLARMADPPGNEPVSSIPPASVPTQVISTLPRTTRYYPAQTRIAVTQRSGGQCEYADPRTHQRCRSRYRLEFDHKIPFARGGTETPENLRHYCRAHNHLAAIAAYGKKKMQKHLPGLKGQQRASGNRRESG